MKDMMEKLLELVDAKVELALTLHHNDEHTENDFEYSAREVKQNVETLTKEFLEVATKLGKPKA